MRTYSPPMVAVQKKIADTDINPYRLFYCPLEPADESRRVGFLELSRFFLVDHSGEDLSDLNHGDDGEAETESDDVFKPSDRSHTEDVCDGLNEYDHACESEGENTCTPEPLVLSLDGEDRAVERSHIKGMEYLAHGEGEECHTRSKHFG